MALLQSLESSNGLAQNDAIEAEFAEVVNPNQHIIDGMLEMATWLQANPELPYCYNNLQLDFFFDEKNALPGIAKSFMPCEKVSNAHFFALKKSFGSKQVVIAKANWSHEVVCEKVVTVETVTRTIPDPSVVVPQVTVTEQVEKVTWKCPESVLKAVSA